MGNSQAQGQRIAQIGTADALAVNFTDLVIQAVPGPLSLQFTAQLPSVGRTLALQMVRHAWCPLNTAL